MKILSKELVQEMVNFISTRPWAEADGLMTKIKQALAEQPEVAEPVVAEELKGQEQ